MDGKVIIVTGATSGIGEAAAKLFAQRGARIVAAGRRTDRGEALVENIRETGGEAVFVTADMSEREDIHRMVETAVKRFGGLDGAFNNAGIGGGAILHEFDDADWHRVMAVNLTGVYYCMKYQIAAMLDSGAKKPGGAAIVNTSSSLGERASVFSSSAYTASKFGLNGLSKQAAIEYVQKGIRVNIVSPGATRTELITPAMEANPELEATFSALNPIGRLIEPGEVAEAAAFLLSDSASGITGHVIAVEGGQLAKL